MLMCRWSISKISQRSSLCRDFHPKLVLLPCFGLPFAQTIWRKETRRTECSQMRKHIAKALPRP